MSEGQPQAGYLSDSSMLAALQELLTLMLFLCRVMFGDDTGREHSPLVRDVNTLPWQNLMLNLLSLYHTLLRSVQIPSVWFGQKSDV